MPNSKIKVRKTCTICQRVKANTLQNFYHSSFTCDALEGQCKDCRKEAAKVAYERRKLKGAAA